MKAREEWVSMDAAINWVECSPGSVPGQRGMSVPLATMHQQPQSSHSCAFGCLRIQSSSHSVTQSLSHSLRAGDWPTRTSLSGPGVRHGHLALSARFSLACARITSFAPTHSLVQRRRERVREETKFACACLRLRVHFPSLSFSRTYRTVPTAVTVPSPQSSPKQTSTGAARSSAYLRNPSPSTLFS